MVIQAEVVHQALLTVDREPGPLLYLSPRGHPFSQSLAQDLSSGEGVRLLCGRYEGIDQRVLDKHSVAEISLGDYILSGGEIAVFAIVDAIVRLLPGVVGNSASLEEETFASCGGLLEYPHYTCPRSWRGLRAPEVLLSGHHARIRAWRRRRAEDITKQRRPDLWERACRHREDVPALRRSGCVERISEQIRSRDIADEENEKADKEKERT